MEYLECLYKVASNVLIFGYSFPLVSSFEILILLHCIDG